MTWACGLDGVLRNSIWKAKTVSLDFKLVIVGEYLRPCTAQRASAHSEDWAVGAFSEYQRGQRAGSLG